MLFMVGVAALTIGDVYNRINAATKARLVLYEYGMAGVAVQKTSLFGGNTLESFSFSYNDIVNVSHTDQHILVHTQWTTYRLLPFRKQDQILKIIHQQRRMTATQNTN